MQFSARLFSSSVGSGNRLAATSSVELQDLEAAAAAGGAKHKYVTDSTAACGATVCITAAQHFK
jgi:hypothetical protein